MKAWWRRCMDAALLNGLIWLTPMPVHFISLFLPFFSGYAIAADRPAKGCLPSLQIGLVMGLTLTALALIPATVIVLALSLLISMDLRFVSLLVLAISVAIGAYTIMAASTGALVAAYRAIVAEPPDRTPGPE